MTVSCIASPSSDAAATPAPARQADSSDVERSRRAHRHQGRDEFRPSSGLRQLFSRLDGNGDGGIDVTELATAISRLSAADPSKPLPTAEQALSRLDLDGDGTISRRELRTALRRHRREEAAEASSAAGESAGTSPAAAAPSSAPQDPVAGPAVSGQPVGIVVTVVAFAVQTYVAVSTAAQSPSAASLRAVA